MREETHRPETVATEYTCCSKKRATAVHPKTLNALLTGNEEEIVSEGSGGSIGRELIGVEVEALPGRRCVARIRGG